MSGLSVTPEQFVRALASAALIARHGAGPSQGMSVEACVAAIAGEAGIDVAVPPSAEQEPVDAERVHRLAEARLANAKAGLIEAQAAALRARPTADPAPASAFSTEQLVDLLAEAVTLVTVALGHPRLHLSHMDSPSLRLARAIDVLPKCLRFPPDPSKQTEGDA